MQEMALAPAVLSDCGWAGGVNQDTAATPSLPASKHKEEGRALGRLGGLPRASLTWHGELGEVWQGVGEGNGAPTTGAGHAAGEGRGRLAVDGGIIGEAVGAVTS